MAEINIQRKRSPWPWIIAAIVALLLVWGLIELMDNDDYVVAPMEEAAAAPAQETPAVIMQTDREVAVEPMPPPPTAADNEVIPVQVIVIGPAPYLGRAVIGTADVAQVVSDRGFWLENGGQRMFAVIAKSPNMEAAVNINPGQKVRLAGVVYDKSMASKIAGGLEPGTMQIIADQPAFLLVDANNIRLMES